MKQYFGDRSRDNHPSKRIAFPNICSICGKPLRKDSKNKIGFICRKCGPERDFKRTNENVACHYCPQNEECIVRVAFGIWVRCETPDFADLERLKITGGLNDERVRAELAASLVGRGSRKVLEEAISQSTQKIYQSGFEGFEGQISVGIRVDG